MQERVEGQQDWRNLGSVRSSATGAFVFKALAGPSRTIRFSYQGTATSLPETKDVVVRVPADEVGSAVAAACERHEARRLVAPDGLPNGYAPDGVDLVVALPLNFDRPFQRFANARNDHLAHRTRCVGG